jgi:hypothetical protein
LGGLPGYLPQWRGYYAVNNRTENPPRGAISSQCSDKRRVPNRQLPATVRLPAIEPVVSRTLTTTERDADYPQQEGDDGDDPESVNSESHAEKEQNYEQCE